MRETFKYAGKVLMTVSITTNMDLLNVLGNEKRRAILRILSTRPSHISALAREIGVSVPVALKHIRLLEGAGLVERTTAGSTSIIAIREETIGLLKKLDDIIDKPLVVKARKGETIHQLLMREEGFTIEKAPGTNDFFITAIDGVKGYYIFQVDGRIPDVGVKEYTIEDDTTIEFQKLIPVIGKRLRIQIE